MDRDYEFEANKRGTRLVQDDSLRAYLHIARDDQPHFPHKKDCGELARGFAALVPQYAMAQGTAGSSAYALVARLVAQSSHALRHCARCPLDACQRLTFGNPANVRGLAPVK